MLNDEQAISLLIANYNQFYKHSKLISFITDFNFKIIAMNDATLGIWREEYLNPEGPQEQVNIFSFFEDYELLPRIKEIHEKIINTRVACSLLAVNFRRKVEYVVMIFHLEPIVNNDTGNLIAITVRANKPRNPLSWFSLPKILVQYQPPKIKLQTTEKFLNTREHEIIFLMFHFETYDEIATVLGIGYNQIITKNAVGKFVRRHLYPKFSVIDNHGLKEKAMKLGYNKKIPLSLIPQMIIELKDL